MIIKKTKILLISVILSISSYAFSGEQQANTTQNPESVNRETQKTFLFFAGLTAGYQTPYKNATTELPNFSFQIGFQNVFVKNLNFDIEAGVFGFKSKNEDTPEYKSSILHVPFSFNISYIIRIKGPFYIFPRVGFGIMLNRYHKMQPYDTDEEFSHNFFLDTGLGFALDISLKTRIFIDVVSKYIFDKSDTLQTFFFRLGMNYFF